MKKVGVNLIKVSIYVGYILVTDIDEKLITELEVKMIYFRLLSFFLGMEVKQHKDGVFICEKKHAKEILNKFCMEDYKSIDTPMNQKESFSKDDGADKTDEHHSKSLIGCLIYHYCCKTKYHVCNKYSSRFMHCANDVDF